MRKFTISEKSLHNLALAIYLCRDPKVKVLLREISEEISSQISDIPETMNTDDGGIVVSAELGKICYLDSK